MNGIERCYPIRVKCQGVPFYKLEWIIGLWLNIDADNLKAGFAVADTGPTSTAKKV